MAHFPIVKSAGTTEAERFLAEIAEKTFLSLWSYPNVYRDQKIRGSGDGKELADLLVVFGRYIIIFSDKDIPWKSGDLPTSWKRWYKRAVLKSAVQVCGAERFIKEFPSRIYLDKGCQNKFPIDISNIENSVIIKVCTVGGIAGAVREHFKSGDGTLCIDLTDKKSAKADTEFQPFYVGNADFKGGCTHVFDHETLRFLLKEFSTAGDFISYLIFREKIVHSKLGVVATSEVDLVAFYLMHYEFESVEKRRRLFKKWQVILLEPNMYSNLVASAFYANKVSADVVSYHWDELIERFGQHVMAGTSEIVFGAKPSFSDSENALRFLAAEDRLTRRFLGGVFQDFVLSSEMQNKDKQARWLQAKDNFIGQRVRYVFVSYRDPSVFPVCYSKYRERRTHILQTYCFAALQEDPECDFCVGIAIDGPDHDGKRRGGSEDVMAVSREALTDDFLPELELAKKTYRVMESGAKTTRARVNKYPESATPYENLEGLSRQRRRALQRKHGK